jgi:hypothetical protein
MERWPSSITLAMINRHSFPSDITHTISSSRAAWLEQFEHHVWPSTPKSQKRRVRPVSRQHKRLVWPALADDEIELVIEPVITP